MKYFNKSLIAALAVAMSALTSCSDDDSYKPGAESAGAYFETVPAKVSLDANASYFTVSVGRSMTEGPATVALELTDESGLFAAPAEVTFADGEATANIDITYNADELVADKAYPLTLTLASDFQYGATTYSFNAVLPSPYTSIGKCTYTDGIVTSLYGVGNDSWEVEIQESDLEPGVYRLVTPYENAPWVAKYSNVFFIPGENRDMILLAQNPNQVYFPEFNTGVKCVINDEDYGTIICRTKAENFLMAGYSAAEIEAAGWFGTLADGIVAFPTNGFLVIEELEYGQGWYTGNTKGAEQILMPGVELSDYSATITYGGIYIDPNGDKFAIADVTLGADVESAIVAAVQTENPQAALSAMLQGQADIVDIKESGRVNLPIDGNGAYVMMVITEAKGSLQDLDYDEFSVELGAKEWQTIGDVEVIDGWLLPYLAWNDGTAVNPEEEPIYAVIEENSNTPGLFRIKSYYNSSILSNTCTGTCNIVVNATDPNAVLVEPQSSMVDGVFGFNGQPAIPYITERFAYYIMKGNSLETILNYYEPNTLKDDVIFFPKGNCGRMFAEDTSAGFYNAMRNDAGELITFTTTMTIYRTGAQAAAAKKRSINISGMTRGQLRGASSVLSTQNPFAGKAAKIKRFSADMKF